MAKFLITPDATLSFPALFEPKPKGGIAGAELVYSCALLFGPEAQETEAFKALKDAVAEAAKAKFGADIDPRKLTLPFYDAGLKDYGGYKEGEVYIQPWTSTKPKVVDRNVDIIIDKDEVWAGQIVQAAVTPFAWANTGKKGVSFGLNHVQVIRARMPRIDGRPTVDKIFKPLPPEEDEAPAAKGAEVKGALTKPKARASQDNPW